MNARIAKSLMTAGLLAASFAANARVETALNPVYSPGSSYSAVLNLRTEGWTLLPLNGPDVAVPGDPMCGRGIAPPKGLWLLGRDEQGRPELIAPSSTLLPTGHSGRIALRSCDDPGVYDRANPAFGVPRNVLESLVAHNGAVLVER